MNIYANTIRAIIAAAIIFPNMTFGIIKLEDKKGTFTLEKAPKRIVVLEFSFVDALASIGISPIGIADHYEPERIIDAVRSKIKSWESVGTRSQPSLEAIVNLKPDLIIADIERHSGIYEDLKKIAPTLILSSRGESYESNLESAYKIGQALDKEKLMKSKIDAHRKKMAKYSKLLKNKKNISVGFIVSREKSANFYTNESYVGGIIQALGLSMPKTIANVLDKSDVSLEGFMLINPDYLFIAPYVDNNIFDKWLSESTAINKLNVIKNKRYKYIDSNIWARSRGMISADIIAREIVEFLNTK